MHSAPPGRSLESPFPCAERRSVSQLFTLFRLLFAVHFVLGLLPAACLWVLIFGVGNVFLLGAVARVSSVDAGYSLAVSALVVLWYYVWYGSIAFALRGSFPLLSIRSYSIIMGIVYAGFGIAHVLRSRDAFPSSVLNQPLFTSVIAVMLLIAICGFTILSRLKAAWDEERRRLADERERRLDQLHPWGRSLPPRRKPP